MMDVSGVTAIYDEALRATKLAESPDTDRAEIVSSTKRIGKLLTDYAQYVTDMASPPSPHVNSIIKFTNTTDWDNFSKTTTQPVLNSFMLTGHEEAQVLRMLVSMSKATRVLEIGMFTGCAALAMAEALPSSGTVVTCEINPELKPIIRKFFDKSPHGNKIAIKIGPAMETLKSLSEEGFHFDFVFIDADKSNYWNYFKFILDANLLAPGGTICVDNTLWYGNAYVPREDRDESRCNNPHVIPEFNEMVASDDRVYRVILPVRDGMMLARRKEDVDGDIKQ